MGFLDQFSPGEQQALKVGVPVVAALGLFSLYKRGKAPASTATVQGIIPASPASTSAIDSGQLAGFETSLTSAINALANNMPAAAPPPIVAAAAPAPSAPAAGTTVPGYAPPPPGYNAQPIVVQGVVIGETFVPQ